MRLQSVLLCAGVLVSWGARGEELPCEAAEDGVVQIDGQLGDWQGVAGQQVGGSSQDLSFNVRCNYDSQRLYLAVIVTDDALVRTREQRAGEDHVEVAFEIDGRLERLSVYPADGPATQKLSWSTGRGLKGVTAAGSRLQGGWSVELGLPLASLPEWAPGASLVHLGVGVSDCDDQAAPRQERFLTTAPFDRGPSALGTVQFAAAKAAFEALLQELHLGPKDVSHDLIGRVLSGGKGRVLVVGKMLALIGEEYLYIGLPVASPRDIRDVQLMDLGGDGRDSIVLRYRERVGGGWREVLAIYRLTADGLRRIFGVEVAKSSDKGERRLETRVTWSPKKRGKGMELVVEALPAVGWSEAEWREAPAEDVVPLPLPWGAQRRLRFDFAGEGYTRPE